MYQVTTKTGDIGITQSADLMATQSIEHIRNGVAFEVISDGMKIIEFDPHKNDGVEMMNFVGFVVTTTITNAIAELESYLED